MSRFFVNIGKKDKLNPARLIGLINEQKITSNIEIGQIEILDTFSFFELDKNFEVYFKEYNFHKLYKELVNFCSLELSAFYFDIRKYLRGNVNTNKEDT